MSEAGTQIAIARARAGAIVPGATPWPRPAIDEAAIHVALAGVMDPELPVVSVVDLGMVHRVSVDGPHGPIRVEILPTFIGCPALELISASIVDGLAAFGRPVQVTATFEVPWSTDRITAAGRAALATAGIAPPSEPDAVRCPHCASGRVVLDGLFGPTQCRSLYYCRDCRQPFEAMKPV